MDELRSGGGRVIRGWTEAGLARVDAGLLRMASQKNRLIGIALLRIVIGLATVMYCLADYGNRRFLWGPDSYNSIETAKAALSHGSFSLFLVSHSTVWFEIVFHATILVSAVYMVYGGRALTFVQAVLMWSLHNRNQDVLEGGDNLAQILIIFMVFTVSNAYFAPGAKQRRSRLLDHTAPSLPTVLHNLAAYLIVFQTAVLYLAAGYWKITGKMWQDGVAMYYISRLTGFQIWPAYAHLMSNAYVTTAVSYFTIFFELALPFAILSARGWVRKANTLALESMHLGIMVFMGLVCFGLLMIGADCTCLRDEDYRSLKTRVTALTSRFASPVRPTALAGTATGVDTALGTGGPHTGEADARS
ncbi:hypothetical protein [Streptomyces sp. NBC_01465]|uniref:hypothetical protein n=1 Tax=Streptomyces sp. NBC_01465 TaxID=2903878 RepID=UPI002E33724E|nr:hypothetical protein [Streptomyces sp. NBC_01465]